MTIPIQIFISFLLWLFLWLPVAIAGIFTVPIALLFERDGHFPRIFWPWDNHSDSVHGTDFQPYLGFWRGYVWTAFRNPCSNWGKLVLGIKRPADVVVLGDESIRSGTHSGAYRARCAWAWEYMWCIAYGHHHFARIRIGWKLAGGSVPKATFVFSISPFRTFNDKR